MIFYYVIISIICTVKKRLLELSEKYILVKALADDNQLWPILIVLADDRKKQDVSKYNVRKSLDWDDAFFTSPGAFYTLYDCQGYIFMMFQFFTCSFVCTGILEPEDLFRFNKSGFRDDILGVDEEILLPSWSFEPELVDDSNLRKSLAWDNAFFSNAGMFYPAIPFYKCFVTAYIYFSIVLTFFLMDRTFGSWGIVFSKQRIQELWYS